MKLVINDRIRNREISFFNNVEINLVYDAVASDFKFDFYFNPDNKDLKDLACIGHYHKARIEHEGQVILSGNILNEDFDDGSDKNLVSFSGGSFPGILEDVNMTSSLQSVGLSLKDITESLVRPYGITVVYDQSVAADVEAKYKEVTAQHTQTIKEYLSELASQKNIVLSHDALGRLVFRRARAGVAPVTHLAQAKPVVGMKLNFGGQSIHSHITVMEQADFDQEIQATSKTVINPFVIPPAYRPRVVVKNSGDTDLDAEKAAKNVRAQELKNVKLTIKMDRWFSANNRIIMPGDIITAQNPNAYLFKKSSWFVESNSLTGSSEKMESTIVCVPPAVYDGSEPVYYWKGINLH